MILLKVIKVENECFVTIGFLIMDSNFKIVCNGFHDLTMLSVNISDIAIIPVKNVGYRCIIYNISKSESTDLLKNSAYENRGYI